MPGSAQKADRGSIQSALRPLFETLESQGRTRLWLARQLGIRSPRLSNYEHGARRIPPDFLDRACQALGIPRELVSLSGPPQQYIQPPKTKKSPRTKRSRESNEKGAPNGRNSSRRPQSTRTRKQPSAELAAQGA